MAYLAVSTRCSTWTIWAYVWERVHVVCQILTSDSVTVAVDAVVYYRISNPRISVVNVENAARSTQLLAQTTLRNILGTKTLSEILTDRESISSMMQVSTHSPSVFSSYAANWKQAKRNLYSKQTMTIDYWTAKTVIALSFLNKISRPSSTSWLSK